MSKRTQRYTVEVGFPIACIGLTSKAEIVLGGGGGPGRSGVQNKLAVYAMDDKHRKLKRTGELVLSSDEDSPTCLAMHPKERVLACSVNASKQAIEQGQNHNCRLFALKKSQITAGKRASSMCSTSDLDYQKSIAFSSSGKLLAGGSTDGTLAVVRYPSLDRAFPFVDATQEINDVDFGAADKWLVAATDAELRVVSTADASLVQAIDDPHLRSGERAAFRFARFGRGTGNVLAGGSRVPAQQVLYTVLNSRGRAGGAYVVQWNTEGWQRIGTRFTGHSAITTFALSPSGRLLAFATASLQIGICDAHSLKVLMRVPAAHGFAITALAFDKDDRHLVSGSADETCQVFVLPEQWPTPVDLVLEFGQQHLQAIAVLLVLLLAVILAVAMRS